MKIFLLVILIFLTAGCDLIKPLPGNDSITLGKEGMGIDKLADKFIEKVDNLKNAINNFKKTGKLLEEKQKEFSLENKEEYADLLNMTDGMGNGKATRIYQSGQFALEIMSELPLPKDNYFYECWLVIDEPISYISAGKLTRETDGKYHLKFIINNDYTNYNKIVITLETDDDNSAPAATILQGKFVAER